MVYRIAYRESSQEFELLLAVVEPIALFLHLLLVEVVDDDTNEQVEAEERAAHDKDDEIDVTPHRRLVLGLNVGASDVDRVVHDLQPSHERRHLEEGEISTANAVKVHLGRFPIHLVRARK